jgi:hypothetical protein
VRNSGGKNQTGLFRRYALDSSFFIDLFSRDGSHPRDRYIGLWDHFEAQVNQGQIIAPIEVREELTHSLDAALDRWLAEHRTIFIEISRPQLVVLQAVVRKYPGLHAREGEPGRSCGCSAGRRRGLDRPDE